MKGGIYVNVNKLKAKMVERGFNVAQVAEKIGIDRSSLYRKLNNQGETLTVKEAKAIVKVLNITPSEAAQIFFGNDVA